MNIYESNGSNEINQDLFGKLFSAGFTILGIGLPVMAGALVTLRSAGIPTHVDEGLRRLVWLLLPAVLICTAQSLLCLGAITGLFIKPRLAVIMTFLLIVYIMSSILIWALITLLG